MAAERGLDGCCVLDVNGVGYEVLVPVREMAGLPGPPAELTLFVHTHVREESLTLFGFRTVADREVFRALMGVSKVGPKLALAIVGEMTANEIAQAVVRGDRRRLNGVSGVGKRLAERLVMELKDKLQPWATPTPVSGIHAVTPVGRPTHDVCGALIQLGFSRHEAEGAVAQVSEGPEQEGQRQPEEILRLALATLG
jgi:Holliday junction DNA helicase RuvA